MADPLDDLPVRAPRPYRMPKAARTKISRAAWMKNNPTAGERAFASLIKTLGIETEFQSQAVVAGYILDFYHVGLRKDGKRCKPFAVEIDGSSHNGKKAQEADAYRTQVLERLGISVVRFTNQQVQAQRSSVAHAIMLMREASIG